MTVLILLAGAVVGVFTIPPLVKKKYIRELIAFCSFLLLALTLAILHANGVHLPDPMKGAQKLFDALGLSF